MVTLTGNVTGLAGDLDVARVIVWLEANVAAVIDGTGNEVRLGAERATPDSTGAFTFADLLATNGATNPTSFQYRVRVDYPDAAAGGRSGTWDSGWFALTANADLADVAAGEYVPPTYLTTLMTQLDTHAGTLETQLDAHATSIEGDLSAAVTQAEAAVTQAEAAAALAVDLSNISTPDALVATLVGDDATPSATRTALSATYATKRTTQDAVVDVNGNGTHTTIEAALADIAAGGRILLKQDPASPIASHWPTGPIKLPNIDGVTIEGWGRQVCGIAFPAGNGFYFDDAASPTNWVFRNLYISGTGLDGNLHGINGRGLDLSGATSGVIDNVRLSSFLVGVYGTGTVHNSHHWRIVNPRFTNCGTGIKTIGTGVGGTNNWQVIGGEISSNGVGLDTDGGAWRVRGPSFESNGLAVRYGGEAAILDIGRLEGNTADIELTATARSNIVYAPMLDLNKFTDLSTNNTNQVNPGARFSPGNLPAPIVQTVDSRVADASIVPGANLGILVKVTVPQVMKISTLTIVPTVTGGNIDAALIDPFGGDTITNTAGAPALGSAWTPQDLTLETPVYLYPGYEYRVAISLSDGAAGIYGSTSTNWAQEAANGHLGVAMQKASMYPLDGKSWSGLSPSPHTPWVHLH